MISIVVFECWWEDITIYQYNVRCKEAILVRTDWSVTDHVITAAVKMKTVKELNTDTCWCGPTADRDEPMLSAHRWLQLTASSCACMCLQCACNVLACACNVDLLQCRWLQLTPPSSPFSPPPIPQWGARVKRQHEITSLLCKVLKSTKTQNTTAANNTTEDKTAQNTREHNNSTQTTHPQQHKNTTHSTLTQEHNIRQQCRTIIRQTAIHFILLHSECTLETEIRFCITLKFRLCCLHS